MLALCYALPPLGLLMPALLLALLLLPLQVGAFPHYGRWSEWNGHFRDTVRQFVKVRLPGMGLGWLGGAC